MNRGSNGCWRTMVGVGVKPSWRNTAGMSQHRIAESRAGRPCSVGIQSERVEAVEGAAGRTTWIAVVGWADETSARRGSAVYPSCARLGASRPPQLSRWRRPAAGWSGRIHLLCGSTNRRENLGDCHLVDGKRSMRKGGSKLSGRKSTRALTALG